MNFLFFAWLSMALIFLMLEIAHPGLFLFLSFCFGALAGAGLSWLGFSIYLQFLASLVMTYLACIFLFLVVRRWFGEFKKGVDHQSNVYALVGRKGWVTKSIEPDDFGFVKLNGETWMARSIHNRPINQGSEVEVLYIRGAHVVVEQKHERQGKGLQL